MSGTDSSPTMGIFNHPIRVSGGYPRRTRALASASPEHACHQQASSARSAPLPRDVSAGPVTLKYRSGCPDRHLPCQHAWLWTCHGPGQAATRAMPCTPPPSLASLASMAWHACHQAGSLAMACGHLRPTETDVERNGADGAEAGGFRPSPALDPAGGFRALTSGAVELDTSSDSGSRFRQ